MELATGENTSSNDVIIIARLASAAGLNLMLKVTSPYIKLKIITSFAGIMFILEKVTNPNIISDLVYATDAGKTRVSDAFALDNKKWKLILVDSLGKQTSEVIKLPTRFFVSRANFKYLNLPDLALLNFSIFKLEGSRYEYEAT